MARCAVALLILASAGAALGQSTATCPWVALGTAERLLGDTVTAVAQVNPNGAGSCTFSVRGGKSLESIEILVGPTDTRPCPPDSLKLKALGNAAVECRHGSSSSQQSDQIAGHIRNMFFVLTMTNIPGATKQEPSDPRVADSFGASPLERLAEQVVGNLY